MKYMPFTAYLFGQNNDVRGAGGGGDLAEGVMVIIKVLHIIKLSFETLVF